MTSDLTNKTVSVIVPCYNRTDYLRSCLESIAHQTYPSIEVIVVDDASTEDLETVVNSIEWPDTFATQYIRLEENRGPGYAREVGRLKATGAFINYQDSDDLFHPEKIAAQVEMLQNHPEAGMCYCITLNFFRYPFDGTEWIRGSHYVEKILPGVLEKRPWATGSCLWTKVATDAIGPWFDGRVREDMVYEVRAGCKEISILYVPKILSYIRVHSTEPDHRVPSTKIYQQAIVAYHEVLRELEAAGKLNESYGLLGITREIFRVCRKLFDFQVNEPALKIMKYLTNVGQPQTTRLNIYFFCAKLILLSRYIFPQAYQPRLFSRICGYAMIVK